MSGDQTRYSRLANITKMINTKLELKDVLEHVVAAICEEIVQCDSIGIYLPQDDGTYKGYAGKPDVINGITIDKLIIDPKVDLLAREVLDSKEAIYIPDTSKDNRPDPGPVSKFGIKSLLCVPIFNGDETYGLVFMFDYGIPMNLTESEIQTVEAYVNMAAVAIRNANNLHRKENLLSEKQLLLDVNRELSECKSMQDVLDTCFLYVGKVLGNTNIAAHIIDPIAERKLHPASLSKESEWTEEDWKKTHGQIDVDFKKDPLFQEVITTRKAIYVEDVFQDPRPNHEACRLFGIKGMYIMPLVAMGEVLGTIPIAILCDSYRNFMDNDLQLAQSIVDATALALFNLLFVEKQEMIIQERTSELMQKNEDLNAAVSKLSRLSREVELILDSAGEGIFGLDLEGNFTFCNPAAATMLGYEVKDELIGQPFNKIYKNLQSNVKEGNFILPENSFLTDKHFYKNDGTPFPVEFVTSSIKEEEEIVGYVITFKDNTVRKKMEEKIRYHAYYDSSTNLPNRVLFRDMLNKELSYAEKHNEQLAVMFLDLDRFKTINDTMGHSIGDELLKKVAERLVAFIPEECTISRQGGDEFTIILPRVKCEEDVRQFSERVLETFSNSFDLNGNEVFIKTSIGISLYPKDGNTSDILVKNADTAMYKAKESSGGNYCIYEKYMDFRSLDSIKLESDLNKALQNNEFQIYYQPQVDFLNKKIVGVEALIRWKHPLRGMISPMEFISIAEETGLIVPIGEWVLKTACKQVEEWHDQGFPPIYLSVNMAAQQFKQKSLIPMIHAILEETGLSPEFLVLELTENAIIKDTEATICVMKQLRELGIRIAIDDFGTGYSSLGYLKNFPIDTLKIDQTFVKDIVQDKNNAAITNTIISLAKNLNLNVIAEGVETQEQIDFLLSSNCSYMQGYYFSRPVSGSDVEKLFYATITN
ncbi:sensor domain-containing phosphodiesterase [Fictibacillus barbaricus]|uniref:Diguanylate cyclase (GGDEF)-like protein/PAS domain S-box-containing protein n=1 Tax=Fictibacillus barbaricus TaxID=182136 RepID=A0ABU1U1F7_9BACL|nr:EAL domain-containing protein [Fictibacillus barbaricus]MDR7073301.1 diguanylate cyclase (GGDEF)-like protein/PAS domain S-box-containing protein [Fictibacillus barbaricus]